MQLQQIQQEKLVSKNLKRMETSSQLTMKGASFSKSVFDFYYGQKKDLCIEKKKSET